MKNMKAPLAVLGSCAAIFWPGALTFGFPGVMTPIWQEIFHVGRVAIGMTIFFMLAAVGIFMFLVGRWQERYGVRRMISVGVILTACSSIVAANATSIDMVYVWAFICGLASCFVYIPALTLVQSWYPEKNGLVSGIVSMVFGLSAAIMSPIFGWMQAFIGYYFTNLTISLLTLVMGLVGAYFARSIQDVNEDSSIGESILVQSKRIIESKKSFDFWESLHTRSFWFLWATWTLAGAAGVSMTVLSTGYGLFRGFSLSSAIIILTAFNLTNGTGRLISGILSDRFGRSRVMSLAFLAAGLAYFALPEAESMNSCVFMAAVVGFAFGSLFSVSAPLVADCFGLDHFGAIFGLTFAAYGFLAGPLGPTLSGYLLDQTKDNFSLVFSYLGTLFVLSGLFIRFVVPPQGRGR